MSALEMFREAEELFECPTSRWQIAEKLYIVELADDGQYCYDVDELLENNIRVIEDRFIATIMFARQDVNLCTAKGLTILSEEEKEEIRSGR